MPVIKKQIAIHAGGCLAELTKKCSEILTFLWLAVILSTVVLVEVSDKTTLDKSG